MLNLSDPTTIDDRYYRLTNTDIASRGWIRYLTLKNAQLHHHFSA
jgi:hypothetical protein